MNILNQDSLKIERNYPHSVETVFAAFSQAEALSAWLSPDPSISMRVDEFNFAPEGRYACTFLPPDGSELLLNGQFLTIDPPNFLSFTWEWLHPDPHAGVQSMVQIWFMSAGDDNGDGTKVRLEHIQLAARGMVDRHHGGWIASLEHLNTYLSKQQI